MIGGVKAVARYGGVRLAALASRFDTRKMRRYGHEEQQGSLGSQREGAIASRIDTRKMSQCTDTRSSCLRRYGHEKQTGEIGDECRRDATVS